MQRHADWEITIPLAQVQQNEVGQRGDYFKIVHDNYTAQYLQNLGVEPTEKHRKAVARFAPLEQCEIEATWEDSSVVARNLRIMQAPIGKSASSSALPAAAPSVARAARLAAATAPAAGGGGNEAGPLEPGGGRWRYASAVPPHVPDAAEIARALGQGAGAQGGLSPQGNKSQALEQMQMADISASEGCNGDLVEELERMRRHARGDDSRSDADPVLIQWGEEGMRELESLKRKFVLPFAAERPVKGSTGTAIMPWQSPEYRARVNIEVPPDHVADVSEPITMTLEQIMDHAVEYVENSMPLELLTTRRDPLLFAAVRERLCSPEATRLTGLLAHLLYWTVFGHLRPPDRRLPQPSQQSLVLTLQELWSRHSDPGRPSKGGRKGDLLARDSPTGVCFVLPVFILALKRGVENVFHTQYAKAFGDVNDGAALAAALVDQLNVLVMNIFDPDCVYASFGALDGSADAIRLWRKLGVLQMKLGLTPATKMLGREFRTTPMMLLLMNGDGGAPENPKTRKLLQKSASDVVLATVSASPLRSSGVGGAVAAATPPRLDERRRKALYRTACKRIASAGMEVVSSSQSSRAPSLTNSASAAIAAAAAAAGAAAGAAAAKGIG